MTNPAPGFQEKPNYPFVISPHPGRVTVWFKDEKIAETSSALVLWESDYRPVFYLPVGDVSQGYLTPADHETYCPYKGNASYWSITAGGHSEQNAVWGYDDPYDESHKLKDHVAFYPDKVDIKAENKPVRG
jgi:uncharacterized protein (DUF427 family)